MGKPKARNSWNMDQKHDSVALVVKDPRFFSRVKVMGSSGPLTSLVAFRYTV